VTQIVLQSTSRRPQARKPSAARSAARADDESVVGATGFEPATFRPQPSGFRRLCVSERPSFPMCPGPWTIWTNRTMHPVPKRYRLPGCGSGADSFLTAIQCGIPRTVRRATCVWASLVRFGWWTAERLTNGGPSSWHSKAALLDDHRHSSFPLHAKGESLSTEPVGPRRLESVRPPCAWWRSSPGAASRPRLRSGASPSGRSQIGRRGSADRSTRSRR
jgi:hypothetical protein